ncbi:MAG: nucleotide sugar dehydrogenase [Candidatus Korarchaeota archaeon]|nr:nucleotide sugar dehydrogenase [Candidatus Korarchaeota archaeon]
MKRVIFEDLETALRAKEAKISVIGQGYIGLPTSLLMARAGFSVYGYDINQTLIKELLDGKTRLNGEKGMKELLNELKDRNYVPTSDLDDLYGSDVVLIAVPTPKGNNGPDISMVLEALDTALKAVRRGGLIVIESTLPPRTFYDVIIPQIEKRGFKVGEDIYLTYCPERALPGNLLHEIVHNFRVIGAIDERSAQLAKLLYSSFVKGGIEVTDPLTAEMVKLVENSYRDLNIAFANEVARICEVMGIDVKKVRELANRHPRVNILIPGIGVGGSCLTKDPLFLYWASEERGYSPKLIKRARDLNSEMPYHYAQILDEVVRGLNGGDSGTIAVLGATYKGDVPDPRESPVEPFVKELVKRGHIVRIYDPLVRVSFGGEYVPNLVDAVKGANAIAFATDHSEFKLIDLTKLRKAVNRSEPVILFDGRMLFTPEEAEKAGFIYISVGRSTIGLEKALVRPEI